MNGTFHCYRGVCTNAQQHTSPWFYIGIIAIVIIGGLAIKAIEVMLRRR